MAVLKQIKFGNSATPIAQTQVAAADESVLSVTGTNTALSDNDDPSYEVDLNISADGTLVKDTTGQQAVLKVGTVPATQVSVDNTDADITATTAQAAFKELKEDIDAIGGAAKSYKIVAVDNPASTSLAEYKIQEQIGTGSWADVTGSSTIVVPKDNAFVTAQLGHVGATVDASTGTITDGSGEDALLIEYVNGSGVYTLVAVPIGAFLKESEFKDGLEVSANGEVSAKLGNGIEFGNEATGNKSLNVKIDTASEKDTQSTPADFLTVGAGGIKISGIKDEIDRKIAALDVSDAAESGKYVSQVSETDGKIAVERVNVSAAPLNGYAKGTSELPLAATDTINQAFSKIEVSIEKNEQVTAAALNEINTKINGMDKAASAVAGQVVTTVSEADGVVSETKANVKDLQLGGYSKTSDTGAIAGTDTINTALSKLENAIAAAADDHTVVEHANGNTHVTVSGAVNPNGGMTYTVAETNIADADDLAAEITRAQSAETAIDGAVGLTKGASDETRTFTPTTNYGTGSTTVVGNMQALDTKLKEVADGLAAVQYKIDGTTLEFFGMTAHA